MDLLVDKTNPRNAEIVESAASAPLGVGEARLRVAHFSLTANNITYAAAGDFLKYWNFFPAPEGKGRIPVWGFAEVSESNADGVNVGDRFYGYYPMSPELVVKPIQVNVHGFTDGADHRQGLAFIYNRYLNTKTDPAYGSGSEEHQMLFRPLFGTAFLIDDFLAENSFFGAKKVMLASASSKTAYSTAFLLSLRDDISVVGLTSKGNVDFVKSMGIYEEVVAYDDISSLDTSAPTTFVDMAGSSTIRAAVHNHFGDQLKYSCSVGLSHWDQNGPITEPLKGPEPKMFFAPDQSAKRTKELGLQKFQELYGQAWAKFIAAAKDWVNVEHFEGAEDLKKNYLAFIEGTAPATAGYIHKL